MTITIPDSVFDGIATWMAREPWQGHFQKAIDDHFHTYCDKHDLETFDEVAEKIGHWMDHLNDIVMNDFFSRDTEDGNVVDLYLKKRGWKERPIPKAYLRAIRDSTMSLYEVSDVRPGESFLARDLIRGGEPIRVEERLGTHSMVQWQHIATRLVEVRGHWIIAGGMLPYLPALSEVAIEEIHWLAKEAEAEINARGPTGWGKHPEPDAIWTVSLEATLKVSSSTFAEIWLDGTALNPTDLEWTVANEDGEAIEFIQLHYKLANGTTQKQLRALLDATPDMIPKSGKLWSWIPTQIEQSEYHDSMASDMILGVQTDNGAVVRGMIKLAGRKLVAEANSAERADELGARLQDVLADLILAPVVLRKSLDQVMAELQGKPVPQHKKGLSAEAENQLLKEFYDRQYSETLDQPIPMLGHKSPRRMVKTPEGRRQVVAWLKSLEHDDAKANLSSNAAPYDFLWMWEELGVSEMRK